MTRQRPTIVPGSGALGAEMHDIDLAATLDEALIETLRQAWDSHLVLVARHQHVDDDQLIGFAQRFGTLDAPGPNPYGEPFHKTHPILNVISNIVEDGKPRGNLGDGEAVWHADMTYVERPPKGGILYALEVPEVGGDTWFANMYAAYETLPSALRQAVERRVAVHDASHNSAGMLRRGFAQMSDVRDTPGARHPLVRTDPATGRRCLFLGRRPRSWIVDMPVDESDALLDELWTHATQPSLCLVHKWQVGDLLMWQNLAVLHRRDAFDAKARRRMHRAQVSGAERVA